ncbi:hypothetical protein TVAG_108140 [Trichomonas vaginalis G3]|uniref:Uncharacterized protein n=1 Tax=Trichomonas vaginalis (strain ATCC PRA-98 / G3) TaxID=412133 RepID=A2FS31_TRIV3|nr:hypothetical protein TVAGG3_0796070 [Trichomonas vaginalis G3]EAX92297.1 hypothetical protein TVAG_108140 [Trichomonas vaginalis G3]KAI5496177.1 hypothetical protein TVAGG3_0796070 [Trichomonas vaginalis G3]|eukprot:XP_001305227.1 hypothetical protein [Trichomonas vaginalis G3]
MLQSTQYFNLPHVDAHPKCKRLTAQSQRDYEKIQKRIVNMGSKVDFVNSYVDKSFGTHVNIEILTSIAKIVEQKYHVPLDRLAKRNRKAMLCWYAENWSLVTKILDEKKNDAKKIFKRRSRKVETELNQILNSKMDLPSSTFDPMELSCLLNFHEN